jgi:hypothetical protein
VPGVKTEISIADVSVDKKTRKQLRKLGVVSADDIKNIEEKNIDIEKASDNTIDYAQLANQIEKSRRKRTPPSVRSASLSLNEDRSPVLHIRGTNLAVNPRFAPVAVVNDVLADVLSSSAEELKIKIERQHRLKDESEVVLTIDPFAVMKFKLKAQRP